MKLCIRICASLSKAPLLQIAGKQAGYRAMAEYYQSLVCKNNKLIGEEISRVEVCYYVN